MRLDRYSSLEFAAMSVDDLAPHLARWVVPTGNGPRNQRLNQGVPANWSAESLLASEDLVGLQGSYAKSRRASDGSEYLLRFVHRDDSPEVLWSTNFRLSQQPSGVLLEAAVARDAPRGWQLESKARPPRVIFDLVKRFEDAVRPRELVLPELCAKSDADAEALVDRLLLAPERTVPVVLVARDVFGSGSAVDLKVVASRLRGIAVVASLDGQDAVVAYERLLRERSKDLELRCFNGAVHSYGPTANIDTDHRLWLRPSLETLPLEIRSSYVGETIARHLSLDRAPAGFLYGVEDFDRRERAKSRPSWRPSTSEPAAPVDNEEVRRLREELGEVHKLLDEAGQKEAATEEARRNAIRAQEIAEHDASNEKTLRESLQKLLEEKRLARADDALDRNLRTALRTVVNSSFGTPSPYEALSILQALYPERIAVLEEALDSARTEGARFRKPAEVWSLLHRLCTGYYDGILAGGEAQAKKVFTSGEFASRGSDTEMGSDACTRDRTRRYNGNAVVMWAHLRAGGHGAAEDCLRIHFHWDPKERRIVVGHCGAHLKEA